MTTWLVRDIDPFIEEVLACCPLIRSIWLVGDAVNGSLDAARLYAWDLIALADPLTLQRLRRTLKLHRRDVRLRVLTGGNQLESAWGSAARPGVRLASDWQESGPGEGYYTESHAAARPQGAPEATRRKAICLWQGIDPVRGPGS